MAQWGDLGEGPQLKNCLCPLGVMPLSMSGVISQLMIGVGVPSVLGGATPGQVVLCCVRMPAEQAMGSKSGSSTPPWPLHQLLPRVLL